ncbi:hypothetical protein Q3V94_00475 [Caloramator sp. CAR-1]|uniref:hypothetical protein n=1 Tax=Caloramator sp. CAR-1 TaxID=3062777 RepID=UPI0026E1237E|nr:hypothetical protein [Caloramator sp. CAR-1]MDO6353558.1 hypothetical protein [Caloramator sp. CAR-1]
MIKVVIPKDTEKLQKQIAALEYQIQHDTSEKNRAIHQQALEDLKRELQRRIK